MMWFHHGLTGFKFSTRWNHSLEKCWKCYCKELLCVTFSCYCTRCTVNASISTCRMMSNGVSGLLLKMVIWAVGGSVITVEVLLFGNGYWWSYFKWSFSVGLVWSFVNSFVRLFIHSIIHSHHFFHRPIHCKPLLNYFLVPLDAIISQVNQSNYPQARVLVR